MDEQESSQVPTASRSEPHPDPNKPAISQHTYPIPQPPNPSYPPPLLIHISQPSFRLPGYPERDPRQQFTRPNHSLNSAPTPHPTPTPSYKLPATDTYAPNPRPILSRQRQPSKSTYHHKSTQTPQTPPDENLGIGTLKSRRVGSG